MMSSPDRVLAVDWSGDARTAHRKIWLCEVVEGDVSRLERGRTRDEVVEHLIGEADDDPGFVVGLDFAFSFPYGFLEKRAHKRIETVWDEAARLGEQWLAHCPFPFWGKPGRKKPRLGERLHRRTELAIAAESGRRPLSVFQIGGAGAVGVGSIRGMPLLSRLEDAGFSIWPFHEPRLPLVVEIWPRLFMGGLSKSNPEERRRFLRERYPTVPERFRRAAEESDDALDALVVASAMDRSRASLSRLEAATDPIILLEGEIWRSR